MSSSRTTVLALLVAVTFGCGKNGSESSSHKTGSLAAKSKQPVPADATPSEKLLFAKSQKCYQCGKTHCAELLKSCEIIEGAAADGPAKGKLRVDLCRSTLGCVLDRGCLTERASVKCYCGVAEGPDCATGKADGPCKASIESGLETQSATKVAVDYTKSDTGGGVALGLVHCLLDNRCSDCI